MINAYQLLQIAILTLFLTACEKPEKPNQGAGLALVKIIQDFGVGEFTICEGADEVCIEPSLALNDLYNKDGSYINTTSNLAAFAGSGIGSIMRAVKFNDGKYIYAFFFARLNELDDLGKIASCHACSPSIGIVAYQFNNHQWAPFINAPVIGGYGTWKSLETHLKDQYEPLKIYSILPEKFLITVSGSYDSQSHKIDFMELIMIGNRWSKKAVHPLGSIITGKTNCSGNPSDWRDWSGDVSYTLEPDNEYPVVTINRVYKETCKNTMLKIPSEVFEFRYEQKKNKYVSSKE
jgi:hypothetical protein